VTVRQLLSLMLQVLGDNGDRVVQAEDLAELDDILKAATPDLDAH
jgi:hypothetical protein